MSRIHSHVNFVNYEVASQFESLQRYGVIRHFYELLIEASVGKQDVRLLRWSVYIFLRVSNCKLIEIEFVKS